MSYSIETEYAELLSRKNHLSNLMKDLPSGYISKKTIRGKKQYYLQRRVHGKVMSTYIKSGELASVQEGLKLTAQYSLEQEQIDRRIERLEQAAEIISENLLCSLMVMKLSAGMDLLQPEQKKQCTSFGSAMNAVEGISISDETASEIIKWHRGEKSFLSVYKDTLLRYGFPLEVSP